jgi:hypothetical protein
MEKFARLNRFSRKTSVTEKPYLGSKSHPKYVPTFSWGESETRQWKH